nr:MAG TPA: hypothetical protein [Caudoviricetes sp.]
MRQDSAAKGLDRADAYGFSICSGSFCFGRRKGKR